MENNKRERAEREYLAMKARAREVRNELSKHTSIYNSVMERWKTEEWEEQLMRGIWNENGKQNKK